MTNKELKLGGGKFSSSEDLLTRFYSKSPHIPDSRPMNWYQNKTESFWIEERGVDPNCPSINPVMGATLNSQLTGGDRGLAGAPKQLIDGIYNGASLEDYGYFANNIIPYHDNDAPPELPQNAIPYPHMKIG